MAKIEELEKKQVEKVLKEFEKTDVLLDTSKPPQSIQTKLSLISDSKG